jgi:hypothetical protein
MNRRQFLKTGVVGSAILAAAGTWVLWRDVQRSEARDPASRIATIVGAIAPVLLAGALPGEPAQRTDAISRTVKGVTAVIDTFPASVRQEIADLFGLLDIGLVRRVLAGVASEWTTPDPAEIAAFLERWRTSRIGLLQAGYFALHDLVLGAWYADPASWDAIGYPGPPNVE